MLEFEANAARLRELMTAEAKEGERDPEVDRELAELRAAWKRLPDSDKQMAGQISSSLGDLVLGRPAAPDGADPGPEESPLPEPPPIEAEQEEARLALQGLAGLTKVAATETRDYEGPRDADALLAYVGLDSFRPGQREAVEAALAGRDSLIVMPTGGGKSLCYQLPGLASAELTIVVSPLIALMADQWRQLAEAGHPVVMVASGLGAGRTREALSRVADGSARIVYCSPERFGSTAFLDAISQRTRGPAGDRRGPLHLGVGARLPPRLPAAAEGRRAARPPDGDGLHRDRDDRGRRGDPRPPRASPTRSRCARASTARTSPSTRSPSRARARRRESSRSSSRACATTPTARRSSTAAPAATPRRSRRRCGTPACSPRPTTPAWLRTSAPRRSCAS